MEFGEAIEIAAVGAVGAVDAVLEKREAVIDRGVGNGEGIGGGFVVVLIDSVQPEIPDMDFDVGEAFEEPSAAGDGGDADFLVARGGLEAVEEGLF